MLGGGQPLHGMPPRTSPVQQSSSISVPAIQVVMARVDAIRRQVEAKAAGMSSLREAFSAAESLMQSYFPGFVDPALRIPAYRADCEVRLGQDIKAARSVWEAALKTPASRYTRSYPWSLYHCSLPPFTNPLLAACSLVSIIVSVESNEQGA